MCVSMDIISENRFENLELLLKIDWGCCQSVDIVHIRLSNVSIRGHCRPHWIANLCIDIHCPPQQDVNSVHRWPLPAAIDCGGCPPIHIVNFMPLGERTYKKRTDSVAPVCSLFPCCSIGLAPSRSLFPKSVAGDNGHRLIPRYISMGCGKRLLWKHAPKG